MLILLHTARGWRTYVVGHDPASAAADPVRSVRVILAGTYLAAMIALVQAVSLGGWGPYVNIAPGGQFVASLDLRPSTAVALALMIVGGLVACRLWSDRLPQMSGRESFLVRIAGLVPIPLLILPLGTVVGYFFLLSAIEPLSIFGLQFNANPAAPSAGYVCCSVMFFLFGVGLRIVSETRNGETLLQAARRLWAWQRRPADVRLPAGERHASILDRVPFPYGDPTARKLVLAMASVFRTEREALRFAAQFGIDSHSIPPGSSPTDLWYDLLRQLALKGRLREAVQATYEQFSRNPDASFLNELLDGRSFDDDPTDAAANRHAMRKK